MIVISKKNKHYSVDKVFFATNDSIGNYKSTSDIISYFYSDVDPAQYKNFYSAPLFSARTDLTKSDEEILADCTKTVRYEILRAQKESVICDFFNSNSISQDCVKELHNNYIKFCEQTGKTSLESFFSENELLLLLEKHSLAYSVASTNSHKVFHIYCYDQNASTLMFSFSIQIVDDSLVADKNSLARANKFLHYRDMLEFKYEGLSVYDWGGLFCSSNPNGIDKFKLSFGSFAVDVNNVYIGNTLKGKLLVTLLKFKSCLHK